MGSKKLTYSIYYTPSYDLKEHNDINYICSDNKIHIRFRDYNKEEIISGFEKKLTYLLTYLMNYSYLPKTVGNYDTKVLMDNFLKTDDVLEILNSISTYISAKVFKGFKLKANYKRSECLPFGCIDQDCFPLNCNDNIYETGSLKDFLEKLKINLTEYLFNDSYMIIIRENKGKTVNNKFINKQNKKLEKLRDSKLDLVELW